MILCGFISVKDKLASQVPISKPYHLGTLIIDAALRKHPRTLL